MTPNNIAGMAALAGIRILALTDHNTTANCPAFFAAAKQNGIIPIAGMELTTAEDIHVVCLFETLESAMHFDRVLDNYRINIPNRPDIFGEQLVMDEEDRIIEHKEFLLINATTLSYDNVPALVNMHGGICYPAHIDKETNGVIATLGALPQTEGFVGAELHDPQKIQKYCEKYSFLKDQCILIGSDAHYLEDIRDAEHYFEIEDEPYSSNLVRANLFKLLRRKLQ